MYSHSGAFLNQVTEALHEVSVALKLSRQMSWHFKSTGKLQEGQEILLALLSYLIASGVLFAYQLKLTKTFVFVRTSCLLFFFLIVKIFYFRFSISLYSKYDSEAFCI